MTFADKIAIGLSIVTADGTTNLNDGTNYKIQAGTRDQVQTQYNQVKATSPALAGEYLIHSVPQMVMENVQIWCYGTTATNTNAKYLALKAAFEHWQYQLIWTYTGYTETWSCNAVTAVNANLGQGMIHNYMASVTLQVPRFPTVLTA